MDILRSLTDPIVANLYRRGSDGRTIFCPWGSWGRAYIVPPEREEGFKTTIRRLYLGMLIAAGILPIFLRLWSLALVPVFAGTVYYQYWSFSRTLTVDESPPPFNRRQALDTHLRATGAGRLWFSLVTSLGFVATGLWLRSEGLREGTFAALFFGLTAIFAIVQLVMFYRR